MGSSTLVPLRSSTTKINSYRGAEDSVISTLTAVWPETIEFFMTGKSDRSVRSDRNRQQFLRIITI